MYRAFIIGILVVVLCLGASIGYFNAQPIHFDYLAGQIELPLIGLVLADFFLAVLLTLLICSGRILGLKAEARRLRKQLRDAEAELKNLRDIPLKDV
jgi:lipopolysaccharide assembly protein A